MAGIKAHDRVTKRLDDYIIVKSTALKLLSQALERVVAHNEKLIRRDAENHLAELPKRVRLAEKARIAKRLEERLAGAQLHWTVSLADGTEKAGLNTLFACFITYRVFLKNRWEDRLTLGPTA